MSKIDIDKFVEHLVMWGALDCNAVQSALFDQGLTFCNCKIQKIGEEKPKWTEEDDYNVQCCIAKAERDIENGLLGRNEELIDWLKSIKQRMEKKV